MSTHFLVGISRKHECDVKDGDGFSMVSTKICFPSCQKCNSFFFMNVRKKKLQLRTVVLDSKINA